MTGRKAAAREHRPQVIEATTPDDIDADDILEQYTGDDERGFLIIGPGRTILRMNPAARTSLGYAGTVPVVAVDAVRDVDFGFAVGEAMHDRRSVQYESYLPEPDRILRYRMIPVLDDRGRCNTVVVTMEDVTRLRYLETVRRDFVANVSHELRTPIASINLLVETLQEGALDDPAAARHFLHRISIETQAMGHLVEELLELSRLETGVMSLSLAPVSPRSLIEEVANRLAPAAKEKKVKLILDLPDDLPEVKADEERLEQVLMNLVHNAVKFTPKGGTVTLRAARQGRIVQMEVSDTGVGMDENEMARIFERFYKVDKGRSRADGAGLGLAIARQLLQLHGTQLRVVSGVGRGSRFTFSLPIAT